MNKNPVNPVILSKKFRRRRLSFNGMRTGIANLPLHYGRAPRWLFGRMEVLSRQIAIYVIGEYGPQAFLKRLSDPFWFQALGAVLGFDWHSSGLTTTVCGALKAGLKGMEEELGIFVAGGKGAVSRRTPSEIIGWGERLSFDPGRLVYASRMAAKVDSAGLQDGFQIYHHSFFFTRRGDWAVVQQGMNPTVRMARRYHWLSEGVRDFCCEPHQAICSERVGWALNMVSRQSGEARRVVASLAGERPEKLIHNLHFLQRLDLPIRHQILLKDINPERLKSIFLSTYEQKPQGFEDLLGRKGVGAKTIRALSLISELIYGVSPSFSDPARFSFTHGGKDGHPFPVDREVYDESISILQKALEKAMVDFTPKREALRRLNGFWQGVSGKI